MGARGEQRGRPIPDYPHACHCPDPGCDVFTFKTYKNGHAVGCRCQECPGYRNRKNQRKGPEAAARRHKRLSRAQAPVDESAFAYDIRISTQDKVGDQVPALFWQVVDGAFFTHAMKQAHDKIPIGSGCFPGVYVEHADGRAFVVLDVTGKEVG